MEVENEPFIEKEKSNHYIVVDCRRIARCHFARLDVYGLLCVLGAI